MSRKVHKKVWEISWTAMGHCGECGYPLRYGRLAHIQGVHQSFDAAKKQVDMMFAKIKLANGTRLHIEESHPDDKTTLFLHTIDPNVREQRQRFYIAITERWAD